jgi:hypothetical protein
MLRGLYVYEWPSGNIEPVSKSTNTSGSETKGKGREI